MEVLDEPFDGVKIIGLDAYKDERGFFLENYQKSNYEAVGIKDHFIQDNLSRSFKNVLRGVHFTRKRNQSQILTVISGKIFDVIVDIRQESQTFGKWHGIYLGEDSPRQIYMSHGFAHGFCVVSDMTNIHYKVNQFYDPEDNFGFAWNDHEVKIDWPIDRPIISPRDKMHPPLSNIFDM